MALLVLVLVLLLLLLLVHAILARLNRRRAPERRIAEHVQIVRWWAVGRPSVEQAAMLRVDPRRIVRWRQRWQAISGRLAQAEQSAETADEKLEMLITSCPSSTWTAPAARRPRTKSSRC